MNALLDQFLVESREALQEIGSALLRLERADASPDELTALFRHVHTLKGNSGLFTYPEMTRVLHAAEDLLDAVRHGEFAFTRDMADGLLDAVDVVGRLCDDIERDEAIGADAVLDATRSAGVLRALLDEARGASASGADAHESAPSALRTELAVADLPESARAVANAHLARGDTLTYVRYTPPADAFFQGDDPLHQARTAPDVVWGRVLPREPLAPLAELDAYHCVLAFELLSLAPRAELVEHLRYVADHVAWHTVGQSRAAGPQAAVTNAPAAVTTATASPAAGASTRTLKVDQGKIDRLMALIGEMVVARNALPYLAERAESEFGSRELAREIKAQHAVMHRIVEEMQDTIMQVRLMPVSFVFQRFPRLVRDLARTLGKDVQLVLEGEETEADKHMIEALADPLVHIVRNSLDHGLETPAERAAAGKPPTGTLRIAAHQVGDRVRIDITDDGRGIDPVRIRAKAVEKGILDAATAERLTDGEAVNLVFAPGFSTAAEISDLSGRGVGMDVVRATIQRLYGTLSLDSTVGEGTRLSLSLPLSMAVTSVMKVESDGQLFGIPMDAVVETVRVPRASLHTLRHRQATVLRDRVIPLRALNEMLCVPASPRVNAYDEVAVLVVRLGAEYAGLLVDDFRGTEDVILKPMSGVLQSLHAYSGSALLGDGTVLMVLDLNTLL